MGIVEDALATNVRRLRETHGLSLSQLSDQTGIAKTTLFKLESGQTNPTLDTLKAIASTFDATVSALLATPDPVGVELIPVGTGEPIEDGAGEGFVVRRQVIGAGTLEIHSKVFHEGRTLTSMSHGHGAREHVIVIEGKIKLGPVGSEKVIGPGDYATYPADRAHHWEAIGGDTKLWIVHTFPRTAAYRESSA